MEELNNPESEIYKELNNPESEIYKETLNKQVKYIYTRMASIKKNKYFENNMGCFGEKEEIANHLNQGTAQNLVHKFFNFKPTKCIICKGKKGENGITQFERAHCNIFKRYDLLMLAIDDLWIDNNTSLRSGDILKLFIQKHILCPIYMLCNICHYKYDHNYNH